MISTALYNEIANTHCFEMQQSAFFNHARMFLSHYRSLSEDEKSRSKAKSNFFLTAASGFKQSESENDNPGQTSGNPMSVQDAFINVICFSGPMMRNGGACAYGSIELRQMIMQAADNENCIGHIFIVDTPGGSSATKYDFQEAMDYAHAKGQETAMLVDGMLLSAGMAWGALCKKRYARTQHSLFGCMGTYASFYTNKSGDVNAITQEMFHVVYADSSPNKNKIWRDAAEGDEQSLREWVNRENNQYLNIIRQGIPNATEEQLLGGEWEAGEVIGTLCDGIRSLDEIVNEMLEAKGIGKEKHEEPAQSENLQNKTNNQLTQTMGKSYDVIKEALEWPSLESGKDNSLWLHEDMADALTAFVENAEKTQVALEAKQADVNNLVEQMKQLKAEHAEALEATRKEAEETAAKVAQAVEEEKRALQEKIASLEAETEKLNATIAEKDEAIKEMAEATAPPAQPAPVQTKQTATEKPILASDFKNPKEAKEAHENLMQMLLDRM